MRVCGIRGAITVEKDEREQVLAATRLLLETILEVHPGLRPEDLASALFTVTADLQAAFPAEAARNMGWGNVPLMCAQEIPVPGSLPRCIRVLLHWNTSLTQDEIRHIYLGDAARLRPDMVQTSPGLAG